MLKEKKEIYIILESKDGIKYSEYVNKPICAFCSKEDAEKIINKWEKEKNKNVCMESFSYEIKKIDLC